MAGSSRPTSTSPPSRSGWRAATARRPRSTTTAGFITMLLRGENAPDGTRVLGEVMVDEAFNDQLGCLAYPAVIESAAPELSNPIVNLPIAQSWDLASTSRSRICPACAAPGPATGRDQRREQ